MHMMNSVKLAGFLGTDAVRDSDDNGNFTILELIIVLPNEDRGSNENDVRIESHDLIVFGGCGEDAATFKKGDSIIVTGELLHTDYESKKTNCKQQLYSIRVTKILWVPSALMAALEEPDVEEVPLKTETE